MQIQIGRREIGVTKPFFFIALSMQAQAQAHITAADVPLILQSVTEHVTSDSVQFNGQSLAGRRVFIASEEIRATFSKVAPSVQTLEAGAATEGYTVQPAIEALSCENPRERTTCRVVDNGLLLTVTSIRHDPRPPIRGQNPHAVSLMLEWSDGTSVIRQPQTFIMAQTANGWEVTETLFLHP